MKYFFACMLLIGLLPFLWKKHVRGRRSHRSKTQMEGQKDKDTRKKRWQNNNKKILSSSSDVEFFWEKTHFVGVKRLYIKGWVYVPVRKLEHESAVVFPQPLVIQVKHPISRLNQFPISRAKNPVRIVPVFSDPVQFNRLLPFHRQVFICKANKRYRFQ